MFTSNFSDYNFSSQNSTNPEYRLVFRKPKLFPDEFYFDEYFLGYRWTESMELFKQIYGLC